jgi:two-component system cell cycle response regulator
MKTNFKHTKVLLIEDNQDHSFLVKSNLESATEFGVDVMESGEKGLEAIEQKGDTYDIVLLDYSLPGQNGLDVLKRIVFVNPDMPVIVITGLGSEAVAVEIMKAGAYDYIIKTGDYYRNIGGIITKVLEQHKIKLLNSQFQKKLEEKASRDFLTGTFNRHRFNEMFEHELERARRYKNPLVMAMIDMDRFKQINDTFGHKMGDYALVCVSNILRQELRASDVISRFGGDEFIVMLPETDKEAAERTFNRVQKAIDAFNQKKEIPAELSISVGLGASIDGYDGLLERADKDMYAKKFAKKASRGSD